MVGSASRKTPHRRQGVQRPHSLLRLAPIGIIALLLTGCGKDSYITETEGPVTTIEFGEGIEVVTPTKTIIRLFNDFTPVTYQGRPAIALQELIGADVVDHPDLYGYRLIGTDGFYPNMPGKGYGDNTWEQLRFGHLDLLEFRVLFQTERDPSLRKGHNVKWLIRVDVLRSIDVAWPDGRKLAPISEIDRRTVPDGYPKAGNEAVTLASLVNNAGPADLAPEGFLYRVSSRDGASLPRLLSWEEMHTTYYVPDADVVVMPEALGPAYQIEKPKAIRLEGIGG